MGDYLEQQDPETARELWASGHLLVPASGHLLVPFSDSGKLLDSFGHLRC